MFSGEKVKLRFAEEKDLPIMVDWNLKPEIALAFGMNQSTSKIDLLDWYQKLYKGRNSKLFAITDYNDELIGSLALLNLIWRRKEAEVYICIGMEKYWNTGYGADALYAAMEYAFETLNLESLYLRVFAQNKRAVKCYEKCGFHKEGLLTKLNEAGEKEHIYLMRVFKDKFQQIASVYKAG